MELLVANTVESLLNHIQHKFKGICQENNRAFDGEKL